MKSDHPLVSQQRSINSPLHMRAKPFLFNQRKDIVVLGTSNYREKQKETHGKTNLWEKE